jgi:FkbM family methyltransferase
MYQKAAVLLFIICGMCIVFIILNVGVIDKVNLDESIPMGGLKVLQSFLSQGYQDNWKCSENDVLSQAKTFQHLWSKNHYWSACYANDYITKLYLADLNVPDRQNKLFFDVGANKGYTIASWLATWMPEKGVSPKSLYYYLSHVLKIKDCGVCSDCTEEMHSNLQRNDLLRTTLEIHAFEPMESTYQALLQVHTWMNVSTLHFHQLAISNITGTAKMSKCPVGGEACGLMSVGRAVPNEAVFSSLTITLDDFVEQKKIRQKIDLLKIDAEGADPLVLQGAKKLFSQEKVRMLLFENHGIGAWTTTSLLSVIESLNSKGFICHMLGKTGMARITDCWSPVFDVRHWSNVLCVHRREKRLRSLLNQLLIYNL